MKDPDAAAKEYEEKMKKAEERKKKWEQKEEDIANYGGSDYEEQEKEKSDGNDFGVGAIKDAVTDVTDTVGGVVNDVTSVVGNGLKYLSRTGNLHFNV